MVWPNRSRPPWSSRILSADQWTSFLFLTLLLVPVAYVKFDALERAVVGDAANAWLARVSAATIGRLRPAADRN
jgi:hypothetical protein